MYEYELFIDNGRLVVTDSFPKFRAIKGVARSLLEDALEIQYNADDITASSGTSTLRYLTTGKEWSIQSEDYVKVVFDINITSIEEK